MGGITILRPLFQKLNLSEGFKMTPNQVEKTIRHYIDGRFKKYLIGDDLLRESRIKEMCFGDLKLSIQASDFHYCTPRENTDYYDEVEIGFPNFNFSDEFIGKYADDKDTPQDTVYGYVPISELAEEISKLLNGDK